MYKAAVNAVQCLIMTGVKFPLVMARLCRIPLALLDLLLQSSQRVVPNRFKITAHPTYQSLHGAVQRMPVVSSELRVRAFERRVSVGLGLLDTAGNIHQRLQC